jgi:hypothetical protein
MAAHWCPQARHVHQHLRRWVSVSHHDRYYTDTEIPDQIKKAQVMLAVYLNNNVDGLGLTGLEDFKNVKVGSLDVTPSQGMGADKIPPLVERYMTGLRISGPGNFAIRRS